MVVLLCLCSFAVADDGLIPVPDPIGGSLLQILDSIECEALDEELGDLSDQIESLKARIAKKQARIAEVQRILDAALAKKKQHEERGEPVPPGLINGITVWRAWLNILSEDVKGLQTKLAEVTLRWSEAWVEWHTAGCSAMTSEP